MLKRRCLLALLMMMLDILMLILLLLNLNADYADTDAELCIKIMSNYVIALYSIVVDYAIKLILHSIII